MDRSSLGSALDGSDLGGNEVQAVRVVSVSHRSEGGSICPNSRGPNPARAIASPRKPLGFPERQSHGARTNPSSCPARPNRARHRLRRAHVSIRRLQISGSWHRASVLLRRLALGIA
jgi:hypothetical protein